MHDDLHWLTRAQTLPSSSFVLPVLTTMVWQNDCYLFKTGCSRKPQKRMQVSWRHWQLYLENLLEAAGSFSRRWISAQAEVPHSCSSVIQKQQTSRERRPGQTDIKEIHEACLLRLVPRLLLTKHYCWLSLNAGKNLYKWRWTHQGMQISLSIL